MAALRALHMDSLRASTGAAPPPPHEWAPCVSLRHMPAAHVQRLPLSHPPPLCRLAFQRPPSLSNPFSLSPLLALSPTLSSHQQYFLSHPRLLYLPPSSSCLSAAHAPYPPPISSACSSSPSRPSATPSPMCVGAAEGGRSHLPSHGSPSLRAARSHLLALLLAGEVRVRGMVGGAWGEWVWKERQGWYEAGGEAVAAGRGSRVAEADGGEEWEEQVRGVETRGGHGGLCGEVTATPGGSEWWLAEGLRDASEAVSSSPSHPANALSLLCHLPSSPHPRLPPSLPLPTHQAAAPVAQMPPSLSLSVPFRAHHTGCRLQFAAVQYRAVYRMCSASLLGIPASLLFKTRHG
ncbi:unnamed protein product [Closterium sp. NIES-64]|nr:unnamed protein product [Closterium sp. NIES-64]